MNSNTKLEIDKLNFDSKTGLIPAVVQDSTSNKILMHAYMNIESLQITLKTKKVTFFSRSRNSIWTKGETSGNYLNLVSIDTDCDLDTLLIQARPEGPTCHLGTQSCFENKNTIYLNSIHSETNNTLDSNSPHPNDLKTIEDLIFLNKLESIIENRFNNKTGSNLDNTDLKTSNNESTKKSYVQLLKESGLDKIIQKVGEEAIETVIAAKNNDSKEFIYEASDLVFHLMVLLKFKNLSLSDITNELKSRHKS